MKQNLPVMNQLAVEERPREKLISNGRASLTDTELLAIILGSGGKRESAIELARTILFSVNGDLQELSKLQERELITFPGIGTAKALAIVATFELGRRRQRSALPKKMQIRSSRDIFDLLGPDLVDCVHEEFWVAYLNRANHVIGRERISSGGVSGTVVDIRMVFKSAVQRLASGLIICHNHPSGNLKPSKADCTLTTKMRDAGKLLDIAVLDHLIITAGGYFSFADEGRL